MRGADFDLFARTTDFEIQRLFKTCGKAISSKLDQKGAIVTLMLLYARKAFGIDLFPGEPFNCDRYMDYAMKEWSCRPEGLFAVSEDVMDDGVFTREELLEEISAQCSNMTLVDSYMECLKDLEDECPGQSGFVFDFANDKIEMFCDGTDVSTWILTVLDNGYTFHMECASVMGEKLMACAQELSPAYKKLDMNMTLTTALEIMPQAVSDMFQCTLSKFSEIPASDQDCGSSWQDMFLTLWLQMAATGSLLGHLSFDERLELQAVKTEQMD